MRAARFVIFIMFTIWWPFLFNHHMPDVWMFNYWWGFPVYATMFLSILASLAYIANESFHVFNPEKKDS